MDFASLCLKWLIVAIITLSIDHIAPICQLSLPRDLGQTIEEVTDTVQWKPSPWSVEGWGVSGALQCRQ